MTKVHRLDRISIHDGFIALCGLARKEQDGWQISFHIAEKASFFHRQQHAHETWQPCKTCEKLAQRLT